MGGGVSITELSPVALGDAVSKLGNSYESASKIIVDSGISGTILFSTVQDNEAQFKSFVEENLYVTKPILQTVLFQSYAALLQFDGAVKSMQFEIRETLQRPPRQILTDLFKIQGIKLDPENVAGAVDEIAAAIHASIGDDTTCDGINSFHCFIGYRVLADKVIAESLYDKLTVKGFKPFLDKFKLKNGMPWKDGFLQGLKGSKCFVSVISSGALAPCRDMSRNHTWDNYLLEIETALQYMHASLNSAYIIPIHVGEMVNVEGRTMLCKFADFAGSLYADTIEGSTAPTRLDTLKDAVHTAKEAVHTAVSIPIHAGEMVSHGVVVQGTTMLGKLGNFAGNIYSQSEKIGRKAVQSHDVQEKAHVAKIHDVTLAGVLTMEEMGAAINDQEVQAVVDHETKPTKSEATSPGPSKKKEGISWWKKGSPGRLKMDAIIEEERAKVLEKTKQYVKEKYTVGEA